MDSEVWKAIPGFEGYYEVSSLGRVRSLDRVVRHPKGTRTVRGRIVRQGTIWSGYKKVCLSKSNRPTTMAVHRIVCAAFHGEPPSDKHHAAHKNGIRDDNRSENLRWATAIQNEADKNTHGTSTRGRDTVPSHRRPRGERHGCAVLSEEQVRYARVAMQSGVSAYCVSKMLGITHTSAKDIHKRKTWRHI